MTVHLLKGSDPVLLSEAATAAVTAALGDRDRTDVLEEFRGDDYTVGDIVAAATTFSMFGDRLVVARNMARFSAADLAPLADLAADPPPDADIVLVFDKPVTAGARANAVPRKLADAVSAGGGDVTSTDPPTGRARQGWIDDRFAASPVRLDPRARMLVEDTLGEDVSRIGGVLDRLAAAHPDATTPLGVDDVAPYLGESGGVPPWELTDAIDAGRTAEAVDKLRRMLHGGARHPLQIMVTLQAHFERMLRLDGSGARDEKSAAAVLGMKGSTFPAKKALAASQRLGSARLARATELLAGADVELRGSTALPPEAVVELLVARLAALAASSASGTRATGSRRR
jgi:DNA polymerase-3 subunit delta